MRLKSLMVDILSSFIAGLMYACSNFCRETRKRYAFLFCFIRINEDDLLTYKFMSK
jgi:hypothetical protein